LGSLGMMHTHTAQTQHRHSTDTVGEAACRSKAEERVCVFCAYRSVVDECQHKSLLR
jgi:hypothetical protein